MPRHALVRLAALDVRRSPDHRSELRSQLLLGEAVRVVSTTKNGAWWRIENLADGYPGWARSWGLLAVGDRALAGWNRCATARIRVPFAEARAVPGSKERIAPLFWNARVIPLGGRGKFRVIKLPDGTRGRVAREALALDGDPPGPMSKRVASLLGTPYLWGGRTPMGIDCSAFCQQVLAEQGVRVPRDAAHQYRASRLLDASEPIRRGDMVFFGVRGRPVGHVGLMLGPDLYAHSRGAVRISSLDSSNPLWEKELSAQLRGFGRPMSNPGRAPERGRPRRGESS